jgi:hypothetical protein
MDAMTMRNSKVPFPSLAEIEHNVIHCPAEWVRDHTPVTVATIDGPAHPRVVFGHGPMGVCLHEIAGETWWLVFWRDNGRLLSCWEDIHQAQTFADTLMRVPYIDEMLAGIDSPSGNLHPWLIGLKTAVIQLSLNGAAALDPTTNRPAQHFENRHCT